LKKVYIDFADNIRPFLDREIVKRDGQVLKADHSFKVISFNHFVDYSSHLGAKPSCKTGWLENFRSTIYDYK
jgi:hypothetical protein